MYLKRLEIQGFKSFAKKTVLEFEPGVTSIVGPNGSGKSNVADSIRWVLGEQSARLMRGKKSDDVIFAGSDKKTRLSFAEVVATFDNSDKRIPVDASEVSIGRRVDRSGESEYLINGSRVRLLDIVDLVLRSNIGTSRYTVIGQGTIDQMILAGPSEIKGLLDEASGVKTYYIKRDKTLRRLETTAQNLMRAEDLIAEIEPRLKSLRRQAKRMEAREEVLAELHVLQREWYSNAYHDLFLETVRRQESLSKIQARRKDLETTIAEHTAMVERKENENRDSSSEFSNIRISLAKLQEKKNSLLEQQSLIRGKMESQKTSGSSDPETLTVEMHSLKRQVEETKQELVKLVGEEKNYQELIVKLKENIALASKSLEEAYAQMSNPSGTDWNALSGELLGLETSLENFFEILDTANLEEAKTAAGKVKQLFTEFKSKAQKVFSFGGGSSAIAGPEKLKELSSKKDGLAKELQVLESSLSRVLIRKEFLEKQQSSLENRILGVNIELQKSSSGNSDSFISGLINEEERIKSEIEGLGQEMSKLEHSIQSYYAAENDWKRQLGEAEREVREKQVELNNLRDEESKIEVEKARLDTHMESLLKEITQTLGESVLAELQKQRLELSTPDLENKIAKLKHQIELIGGVDELTLQEYRETEERFEGLSGQVSDLKRGMEDLRQIIEELDEHIRNKFNDSFHKINEKFEFYFRMLFTGGRGQLSVLRSKEEVESAEEGEEEDKVEASEMRPEEKIVQKYEQGPNTVVGIDIKATPPGKKLSSIQALSGGERALTSIALLCSMLACFPSPFVVLDEVDAALDEANTIRFGQIIATLSHQTQFVTITHNRETMAQSNTLYGVTMGDDGISKLLSIKFDQASSYAK